MSIIGQTGAEYISEENIDEVLSTPEELSRRFYEVAEEIGAISMEDAIAGEQREYDDTFWSTIRHLPNPTFAEIQSEKDDLRIAHRMRRARNDEAQRSK